VLLVSFVGFGFQYRAKRLAGKNISKTICSASSGMLNLALSIIYLAGMYVVLLVAGVGRVYIARPQQQRAAWHL